MVVLCQQMGHNVHSYLAILTVVCAKIPSVANAIESNETCHGCNQKAPLFADISAQCTAVHTC